MGVRTITRRQRILASSWPITLSGCAVVAVVIYGAVSISGPIQYAFSSVWSVCCWLTIIALSFFLGYYVAIPALWILWGPVLMDQGERNGGPFHPGDQVQILCGPHRDTVTHVYAGAQYERVHVELGEEAKESCADIFAAHELLRVDGKRQVLC